MKLVPSGAPLPGARIWCDLKPAGWTPKVVPSAPEVGVLEYLPPGGRNVPDKQKARLERNSASGESRVIAYTPPALKKLSQATESQWIGSCHAVR